ncbi:hypothetical protein BH18ACI3_BH18ACI3_14550 [soil metagenome]
MYRMLSKRLSFHFLPDALDRRNILQPVVQGHAKNVNLLRTIKKTNASKGVRFYW